MRFFLISSVLVLACTGAAPADVESALRTDVPSFGVLIPQFGYWGGTLAAENAPVGPVKCPVTVAYDAKVRFVPGSSQFLNPNPPPGEAYLKLYYGWTPFASVAGTLQVSNAPEAWMLPLLKPPDPGTYAISSTATITYQVSSPAEGSPVSFHVVARLEPDIDVTFATSVEQKTKQRLQVVSHIVCSNGP